MKCFFQGLVLQAGSGLFGTEMNGIKLRCLGLAALVGVLVPGPVWSQDESGSYKQTLDVIDAVYSTSLSKTIYIDHTGAVGSIEVNGTTATVRQLTRLTDEDFTVLLKIEDDQILIGSAKGKLYRFDGTDLNEVAELSEYQDPILALSVLDGSYWATGARGLIATSTDAKDWQILEIGDVRQPPMALPGGVSGTLYFGVANIVSDTVKVTGMVKGKPAVAEEDYVFYPDEGMIEIINPFDAESSPSVAFDFRPGPPFQAGDVSWNIVLQNNGRTTLAGEFGLIFQSDDNGETWVRRNGRITKTEAAQSYWISGYLAGDQIVLGGAAGLVGTSEDSGENWVQLPRPGREGVFGVRYHNGNKLYVAGAVGLAGTYDDDTWNLVDRSATNLYSWMKSFVELENGTLLLLGGNSTALTYSNGEWERIQLNIEQ